MIILVRQGNPENMWSHDLYNEDEERRRGGGVDRDLGNTGFLKRSLGGGGGGGGSGSDKTTVEITNLSYDVSSDDLKVGAQPLSCVCGGVCVCGGACACAVCACAFWLLTSLLPTCGAASAGR